MLEPTAGPSTMRVDTAVFRATCPPAVTDRRRSVPTPFYLINRVATAVLPPRDEAHRELCVDPGQFRTVAKRFGEWGMENGE